MKRFVLAAAIAAFAIAPVVTHAQKGWKVRADRSTNASDPDGAGNIKFMEMGSDFHAVNPQAAVYWNPTNTATGNYTLKGSFKLVKPSGHTNYYGLVFGGSDLEGPTQAYTYFVVGQDGTWLIKKRDGDTATSNVAPKTPNEAVKKPGADGTSVNALEVRVAADKVDFVINGTVVHSMPKAGLKTDGIAGIRVNHQLEVMISGFAVAK
jgi:hypothetical protein